MFLLGSIVNALAILVGTGCGLVLPTLSDRAKTTIMQGLSLTVILIGLGMALTDQKDILIIIVSMVIGGLIGEWLDIEGGLTRLGHWVERRAKRGGSGQVAQAFVATSLVYCVGSMAIVGSIESGLHDDHKILYAKSLLDGFSSIIFTSTLGVGVGLSAASVFLYEGTISLIAALAGNAINDAAVIAGLTATGGLLIVGIGINLLGVAKIAVGNLLPSVFVTGLLCWLWPIAHGWLVHA